MKRIIPICVVMFMIIFQASIASSENPTSWKLLSIRMLASPLGFGSYLSINDNANLLVPGHGAGSAGIFDGNDGTSLNALTMPATKPYWIDNYSVALVDAVRAEEFFPEWENPCVNISQKLFAVYNGNTNTIEKFCVDFELEIWSLEPYPFDPYFTLANGLYLINLRDNSWEDLTAQVPSTISVTETQNWTGVGLIWWDTMTRLPMARIVKESDLQDPLEPITQEWVKICSMSLENCHDLFTLSIPEDGAISDLTLAPSGQTLLWTKMLLRPDAEYVLVYSLYPIITDILAYATDIETGTTTEIFKASDHITIPDTKAIETDWSPSGDTLALSLQQYSTEGISSIGLLVADFKESTDTP